MVEDHHTDIHHTRVNNQLVWTTGILTMHFSKIQLAKKFSHEKVSELKGDEK